MRILEFDLEAGTRYISGMQNIGDEDVRRAAESFRAHLSLHPSAKDVKKLYRSSEEIPAEVMVSELADFYRERMEKLNRKRAKLFTGYGQCEGFLVTDGRNILVACCPQMAE